MSDLPPGFPTPPPPPPGAPPPSHGGPGFAAPPAGYPPAQQPAYSSGWQRGQAPQPYATAAVAASGAGALVYQFGGAAAWSIGCGLISMVVPFVFNIYFPILPIVGALNGFRAIQRGRVMGGAVGIGVNILGGLVSLVASGILFGGQ
ncbi:MAG TPA: hypothetical protein VET26_09700 [Candidatus Sulfotelmatobacter sp.]|nr:hypothetical protein [Candidatus Sulfotelmatobacter sp.]